MPSDHNDWQQKNAQLTADVNAHIAARQAKAASENANQIGLYLSTQAQRPASEPIRSPELPPALKWFFVKLLIVVIIIGALVILGFLALSVKGVASL